MRIPFLQPWSRNQLEEGRGRYGRICEDWRIRMDEPKKYDVIIDRISQDIPFYRAYLKNAALQGRL